MKTNKAVPLVTQGSSNNGYSSHVERQKSSFDNFFSQERRAVVFVYVVFALVILFIVWAAISSIAVIMHGQAQVIAAARTQIIQAADNGVVEKIMVSEGTKVKKGELLVKMEQDRAIALVQDSISKVQALRAAQSRLQAEVYGYEKPIFPDSTINFPAFRENQMHLFQRRKQALDETITAIKKSRALVTAELNMTTPLLQNGDVGKADVIRLQRQISDLDGQIVNIRNKYFQDAQTDMTKVEEELATQEQQLQDRKVVLGYTEVKAPVDGIVNKISVTTIGAAVHQGEVLMEILPTSGELILEAKIKPADMSGIKTGLKARVKLDAFDYSIYGTLDGIISYVSSDALSEADGHGGQQVFYRVHVNILPNQINQQKIIVSPGMTGQIDIYVKNRTVLSYLIKPISKTLSESMTER